MEYKHIFNLYFIVGLYGCVHICVYNCPCHMYPYEGCIQGQAPSHLHSKHSPYWTFFSAQETFNWCQELLKHPLLWHSSPTQYSCACSNVTHSGSSHCSGIIIFPLKLLVFQKNNVLCLLSIFCLAILWRMSFMREMQTHSLERKRSLWVNFKL